MLSHPAGAVLLALAVCALLEDGEYGPSCSGFPPCRSQCRAPEDQEMFLQQLAGQGMHLLLSPGYHLGQHTRPHRSLRLGSAEAPQEIPGQVRVLALEGQRLCHLLPAQAWVPPEREAPSEFWGVDEDSAEQRHEALPARPAESSQGSCHAQSAAGQTAAPFSEECPANGFALEEKHLEEKEIRNRRKPSSPEEFGVPWVPLTPPSVVRAEGMAISGRGKKWKSPCSCCVNQYCIHSRDCCKGKTESLYSHRCVVELNCAFFDQARVLLVEYELNSALDA